MASGCCRKKMRHRIGPDAPVLLAPRHLEGIYPKPIDTDASRAQRLVAVERVETETAKTDGLRFSPLQSHPARRVRKIPRIAQGMLLFLI